MKKILFIVAIFAATCSVTAQSTSPRHGQGANQDNTGRSSTYSYKAVTDASGVDSVTLRPSAYDNTYRVTLTDTLTLRNVVTTSSMAGDRMTLIVSAASGTPRLKFTGSNWQTAGSATLSTGLRAVIGLIFDGAKWVEMSRVVQ